MNFLPPPGPERRRQMALLSVLVLVLAAYVAYLYWPKTAGAVTASNRGEQGSASKTDKLPVPQRVKLDLLDAAPPGSEAGRNPFRFGPPPAPPPPPPAPIIERPAQDLPPPPPPVPQVPLKLLSLGKVSGSNQPLVNLIDPESGANFWVREGDVVDGKYKLVKVNRDSVIVAFRDGTGQKPLYIVR